MKELFPAISEVYSFLQVAVSRIYTQRSLESYSYPNVHSVSSGLSGHANDRVHMQKRTLVI